MPLKTAFVTVGTTLFDKLIQNVTNPTFLEHLVSLGYTRLVIQFGKGANPVVTPATTTAATAMEPSNSRVPNDEKNKEDVWKGFYISPSSNNGGEVTL